MMPKPCELARQLPASTVLRLRRHKELCQLRRLLLHIWPSVERAMFGGQLFCHVTVVFVSDIQDNAASLLACASNCEAE